MKAVTDPSWSTKLLLLVNNNNIMYRSTITSLGAVFAERLNRIFRDQPKKSILERCDGI